MFIFLPQVFRNYSGEMKSHFICRIIWILHSEKDTRGEKIHVNNIVPLF